MAKILWTEDLNTGIREIDRQHQRIIDYLNQLGDLRQGGHAKKTISRVLDETIDYTVSHFVFEEGLMEKSGYHFSDLHRKVHDIFIRKLKGLKAQFDEGEDIVEELRSLLSRWLFNHIRTEDKNYVAAVKIYLKTVARQHQGSRTSEEMDREILYNDEVQTRKKSWLKRLFG